MIRKTQKPRRLVSREGALFELQIHPGDIRRRVRYLFFSPRRAALLAIGLLAYVGLVGFAVAVTPEVVKGLIDRRQTPRLVAERQRQGERLEALVGTMAELEARSEALRLQVDKARLAYGLSSDGSIGQGGFPMESAERARYEPASGDATAVPPALPKSIFADVVQEGRIREASLTERMGVLGVFLDEVQALERADREAARVTPSINPLKGKNFYLTSPFGNRRSPFTKALDFHSGIDMAAPIGKPIHAPADGVVVFAGRYPHKRSVAWWRYGNLVVLRHGDEFLTLFGHCDEIEVRRGGRVEQGDVIGTVGDTGWSTSPHLHYEVRRRGDDGTLRPVDPRIYILDHRWRDEERILVRARSAPALEDYEPLPRLLSR